MLRALPVRRPGRQSVTRHRAGRARRSPLPPRASRIALHQANPDCRSALMNTMFPPSARRSSNPRGTGGVASGGGTIMDESRAQQFTGRVLTDTAAAATVVMAALGDRLGLFK